MPQGRSAEYGVVAAGRGRGLSVLCWWTWAKMVSLGGGGPGPGGRTDVANVNGPVACARSVWVVSTGR